jgi:putative phosphoribosyl transferase
MIHSEHFAGGTMQYRDRAKAGQRLAEQLTAYANRPDVAVLALPRGGVPVAFEVAQVLNAPLDVFVVRKLGVPGREELAMGAIAAGGVHVLNEEVVRLLRIPEAVIGTVAAQEQRWARRCDDRPALTYSARSSWWMMVWLPVLRCALQWQSAPAAGPSSSRPRRSPLTCDEPEPVVVCASTPEPSYPSVWYEDFSQTSDASS